MRVLNSISRLLSLLLPVTALKHIHDQQTFFQSLFQSFHDIRKSVAEKMTYYADGVDDTWLGFAYDNRFQASRKNIPLVQLMEMPSIINEEYTHVGIVGVNPASVKSKSSGTRLIAGTKTRVLLMDATRVLSQQAGELVAYDEKWIILREAQHGGIGSEKISLGAKKHVFYTADLLPLDVRLWELDNFGSIILTPRYVFGGNGTHLGFWSRNGMEEPIGIQPLEAWKITFPKGGRPMAITRNEVLWLYPDSVKGVVNFERCLFEADDIEGKYLKKHNSLLEMDQQCNILWKSPQLSNVKQFHALGPFLIVLADGYFNWIDIEEAKKGYGTGPQSVIRHRWDTVSRTFVTYELSESAYLLTFDTKFRLFEVDNGEKNFPAH